MSMPKAAIILSGCGYLDGAEIHESVLCMVMLARHGHQFMCFAPDQEQAQVTNHITQHASPHEQRNSLVEAARIARGKIAPLETLKEHDFHALILPGGMGVALNLSNFAEQGSLCHVNKTLKSLILKFYEAKKPIGATCIAPIVIAKALEGLAKVEMTLGMDEKQKEVLGMMGMKGRLAQVHECVADLEHRVFTTPCYMEPDDLAGMSVGVETMIKQLFSR
jgi:enhancing lycopene biosynthesis protein 2